MKMPYLYSNFFFCNCAKSPPKTDLVKLPLSETRSGRTPLNSLAKDSSRT